MAALASLASIAKSALPSILTGLGGAAEALGVSGVSTALSPLGGGKLYSVKRRNGRLVDQSTGRTIGYTPQAAKKKYRTRRRRKRWTKADERSMQWQAYMTALAAGKSAVPPPPM